MKKLFTLILLTVTTAAFSQWGVKTDSLGHTKSFTIDTVGTYRKPDTTYGYILTQMCQQCQPIYRPIISIRHSPWGKASHMVRYWHRAWVFGRIQYRYKPVPASWKIIDYKQSSKWK